MPQVKSRLFAIYFNSNLQIENVDTVWGLGFKIQENVSVKLPLKKAKYEYDKVARMIHVGPYEIIDPAYNIIISFVYENGMEVIGPPVDMWLDDSEEVPPESCRTEIIIPVRKVKK